MSDFLLKVSGPDRSEQIEPKNECYVARINSTLERPYTLIQNEKAVIREAVCTAAAYPDEFGNFYCIFHLPKHNLSDDSLLKLFGSPSNTVPHPADDIFFSAIYNSAIRRAKQEILVIFKDEFKKKLNQIALNASLNLSHISFPEGFDADLFFISPESEKTFPKSLNLSYAIFNDLLDLSHATFEKQLNLTGTCFKKEAKFEDCAFLGGLVSNNARFEANVSFKFSVFASQNSESSSIFDSNSGTAAIQVQTINFADVEFAGKAEFSDCEFTADQVFFQNCNFRQLANFKRTTFYKRKPILLGGEALSTSTWKDRLINQPKIWLARFQLWFRKTFNFRKYRAVGVSALPKAILLSFEEADFYDAARFTGADPMGTSWNEAYILFEAAYFKEPSKVGFGWVTLNPTTFFRTDPKKLEFTSVEWQNLHPRARDFWPYSNIRRELKLHQKIGKNFTYRDWNGILRFFSVFPLTRVFLRSKKDEAVDRGNMKKIRLHLYNQLSQTSQRLGISCEEDNRYRIASDFRFMAMESSIVNVTWPVWLVDYIYKILSGYGERPLRASIFLLILFFAVPLTVYLTYGEFTKPLEASPSLLASFLGKDQNKPSPEIWNFKDAKLSNQDSPSKTQQPVVEKGQWYDKIWYALENMLLWPKLSWQPVDPYSHAFSIIQRAGFPLQLALFALAMRRRYMR